MTWLMNETEEDSRSLMFPLTRIIKNLGLEVLEISFGADVNKFIENIEAVIFEI